MARLLSAAVARTFLFPGGTVRSAASLADKVMHRQHLRDSMRDAWHDNGYSRVKRKEARFETVKLLFTDGKPMFEIQSVKLTRRKKCLLKKRFLLAKAKARRHRKEDISIDPRSLDTRVKNQRFATAEHRLNYVLNQARRKEASLVEKLKQYDIRKMHGPAVKPCDLSNEELHFLIRMTEKQTNYVPIGTRGIFGGVILNMHLHWKFHETVKVICKCKPAHPGRMQEYASELARLSGGIPIQFINDNTVVFYRGKNYEQPDRDAISPIDTLTKRKALQRSKDAQALETVRHFIAICEKQLELYKRHVALYANPQVVQKTPLVKKLEEILARGKHGGLTSRSLH